jgi:hypothetical protein
LGSFVSVESGVDFQRQFLADAFNGLDVFNSGTCQTLEPTKLPEQSGSALGADATDVFQYRPGLGFSAALTMPRYCETMGLVAYLLHEVQCGRIWRQYKRLPSAQQEQLFHAGTPVRPFGHAQQQDICHPQVADNRGRRRQLALATIDQEDIGQFSLAGQYALVAPFQCLAHRRIIVTRGDSANIETPVIGLAGSAIDKHDAGGHRLLALDMADIEALQALRRLRQLQGLLQGLKACARIAGTCQARRQRQGGIVLRHL